MPTPPSEYRYPCENCGASLEFSPGQQSLVCPYCGHEQHIGPGPARAPARQAEHGPWGDRTMLGVPSSGRALQWDGGHKSDLTEIPLERGLRLDAASDLTENLRTLSCPNCGAKVEITSDRHASTCPFCATAVVTDTGPSRQIKPQGVLPFVITEQQARAALEDWLRGLWFAPSGLTAYARRGKRMSGVYSPFWTFDADTRSTYSGARGDWYFETVYVTQTVNGRPQRVAQQVRRTRWTPVSGQVARNFDDVLVLAASSLPRRITDALAPWDLSHLMPYRPEYLAGFLAEGYTVPLAAGHDIARQEMAGVIAMDVRRAIGGNEQQISSIQTRHSNETFKHILLPVWTAAYRYNGQSYRFVVNGQSGRVQGERPWSVWKIALAVLLAALVVAALLWLNQGGQLRIGQMPAAQTPTDAASAIWSGGDDVILCVGESLIDMLPQPDGSYRPLPGGSVYNTALALGRLGVPTGYLWPLGNDGFAEMLLARLQAAGVATDLCPRPDLPTSLAFVSLTGAEARYVFYTQGTAGGRLDAETLPDLPGNTDALFIGGISLAQDATAAGVEALVRRLPADIPVILDANIRPPAATDGAAYRQRLQRLLARADLVKLSVEDLHWLMPGTDPDAAAATILGQGARAVLLTRGAAGASAYGPGGGRVDCSAVPTVAADSIGAGDTFNAGVLAALHDLGVLGRGGLARLGPGILGRALSQGCHAAAIAVSRPGADPPWRHELAAAMTAGGATAP